MWTTDIIKAMEEFQKTFGKLLLIESIASSYDGIVIRTTTDKTFVFSTMDNKLYQIGKWKNNS